MKRIKIYIPILLMLFSFLQVSAQDTDFFIDERDDNIYLVAKFNNLWWMCQNLKYDVGEGSGCYEDDETNCMLKGRLYNWEAAQKVCPEGYHLPDDDEWKSLEAYIGMDKDELDQQRNRNSGTVGKFLKIGGGLGFDADFIGMINAKGNSSYTGLNAYFWTATESDDTYAWTRVMYKSKGGVDRLASDKKTKYSVRCVKAAVAENDEED